MLILRQGTRAELIVRKSRFLAEATPVASPEAARDLQRERKRVYAGCSHVVFAFICGPQGGVMGCSDDGEPSGTAGRPVMEVLKGSGITNVLLTVTRWFGGTLLGTGGLVRAYTESAQLALADAPTAELVPLTRFTLALTYLQYETVRRRLAEFRSGGHRRGVQRRGDAFRRTPERELRRVFRRGPRPHERRGPPPRNDPKR